MCVNVREAGRTVWLKGAEVPTVQDFQYFRWTVQEKIKKRRTESRNDGVDGEGFRSDLQQKGGSVKGKTIAGE